MMQKYISTLVDDLPIHVVHGFKKKTLCIDLVLDGGSFNGSYLVGAILFLKEMEKRKYIKIKRISGCSIGSVVGLLYFMDGLEMMMELYKVAADHFKQNYNLESIKTLKTLLKDNIPNDICKRLENKFFVTYHNIFTNEKIVQHTFQNVDDVFECIVKSCFIPYLIDGHALYDSKYIDGLMPYIFDPKPNRKILYLDLFGYDKLFQFLSIKNENTNLYRVFSGALDVHYFYMKEVNSTMCSYVNDWTFQNKLFLCMKLVIEKTIVVLVKIILFFRESMPLNFDKSKLYHASINWIKELYIFAVKSWCI
jgi:hypothetical protein